MKFSNKALISGAFLAAAGLAGTATAGSPEVYGKANISYQNTDDGTDSAWELNSNASRLGVKGSHELEGGLEAFYKAEFEIQIDDGDKGGEVFSQRNIEAGLKGNFGLVKAGRFDTIIKKGQGKVDLFNDLTIGDIGKVINGDTRGDNTLHYASPTLGDNFVVKAEVTSGETAAQDGPADAKALAVEYAGEGVWASVAYTDGTVKDGTIVEGDSVLRAAVQFSAGIAKLGALVQSVEKGAAKGTEYVVSAAFKVAEKDTIKVQYADSDADLNNESQVNVGWDHKLSKKVKTFVYYGSQDQSDKSTFGAGMEVKF